MSETRENSTKEYIDLELIGKKINDLTQLVSSMGKVVLDIAETVNGYEQEESNYGKENNKYKI